MNIELRKVIKTLREKLKEKPSSPANTKENGQNIQIQNLNNLYQNNSFFVDKIDKKDMENAASDEKGNVSSSNYHTV